MADPILILHTKGSQVTADKFQQYLKKAGYYTVTFEKAMGKSSHLELQDNWPIIAASVSGIIILASPDLIFDRYITEMSLDAIASKKGVCVVLGFCDRLPLWFTSRAITIGWKDERSWSNLAAILNKFVPIRQKIEPRPKLENKVKRFL